MPVQPPASPPPSRLRRGPWRFRRLLLGLAAGVGLPIVVLLGFVIQGRWEWSRTKAALIASGENFSREDFIPPPIPDAENFFAAPIWDELIAANGDMKKTRFHPLTAALPSEKIAALTARFPGLKIPGNANPKVVASSLWTLAKATADESRRREIADEILVQLTPTQPFVDEFRALLARPGARAPMDYKEWASVKFPHLTPLLTLGQFLQLRAQAELMRGDRAAARADTEMIFRAAGTFSSEPFLLSHLVRIAMIKFGLAAVNAGIEQHQWSDADLAALSATLERIDLIPPLARAIRCEAAYSVPMFEQPFGDQRTLAASVDIIRNGLPWGDKKNAANVALAATSLRAYAILLGPRELTFYQSTVRERARHLDRYPKEPLVPSRLEIPKSDPNSIFGNAMHPLSSFELPSIENQFVLTPYAQASVALTGLACMLERARLAAGAYPEKLSDLVPQFLPAVPRDPFGHALHYARGDDAFRLWSDGWNLANDEGIPSTKSGDYRGGDWAWNLKPGPRTR